MLYIYSPLLYYHGNLYVTEGAYAGGRGFPLSQRSFFVFKITPKLCWAFIVYNFIHL